MFFTVLRAKFWKLAIYIKENSKCDYGQFYIKNTINNIIGVFKDRF